MEQRPPNGADASISQAFQDDGFVVIPGLVGRAHVCAVREAVDGDLKSYRGWVYRQTTGVAEVNRFDPHGFIMNPVLNVQSVRTARLGGLRRAAEAVFTSPPLQAAVAAAMGERPALVQSMLFEGNTATPAHQDAHYLDADEGEMVAAWIALEDIHEGAGRFYVHPGSHRGEPIGERLAPALKAGDVLLWHSRTVHGSLTTTAPDRSRLSLTAHFIPLGASLRQFERRTLKVTPDEHGIHRPKDQNRFLNRVRLFAEAAAPARILKRAILNGYRRGSDDPRKHR